MAFCTFLHVARISSCSWTMQSKKQRTQSGISLHGNATTSRENRLANLLSRTKNAFLGARPPETNQSTKKTTNPWGSTPHKAPQMGPDINKSEWEPQPWLLASGYHGCTCPADSEHGILPRAKAWRRWKRSDGRVEPLETHDVWLGMQPEPRHAKVIALILHLNPGF